MCCQTNQERGASGDPYVDEYSSKVVVAETSPVTSRLERRRPRSLTWAFGVQMVAGVGFEPTTFGL